MSKEITSRADDYSQWYNDLIIKLIVIWAVKAIAIRVTIVKRVVIGAIIVIVIQISKPRIVNAHSY